MEDKHWIDNERNRKAFWARCNELGLDGDAVHALFGVESMKEYAYTAKAALDTLSAVEAAAAEVLPPFKHTEATCSAWTDLLHPSGAVICLTVRQGATGKDVVTVVKALDSTVSMYLERGWAPAPRNGHGGPIKPVPPAHRGIAPDVPPPPPPQPPTPETNQAPAPEQPPGTLNVEPIHFLKVTAPRGKPQVEFWRDGRDYFELRWNLGGARLLELAPSLAAAGYTVEHLDAIGFESRIALEATWVPSPKNPKWKDITGVKVVGA